MAGTEKKKELPVGSKGMSGKWYLGVVAELNIENKSVCVLYTDDEWREEEVDIATSLKVRVAPSRVHIVRLI